MSSKNYWKPHFVITPRVDKDEDAYYHSCGVSEVHYENDVPVGWTSPQTIDFVDEDMDYALKETKGLMTIYLRALSNVVYIVSYKDDMPYLEIYEESS